jgi:outer membrane protein assembly factor BamB
MPALNPNLVPGMLFIGANVIVGSTPTQVEVGIFANSGTFNGAPVTAGEVLWFFTQSGIGTVIGSPISNEGVTAGSALVFFADSLGNVFALNALNGQVLKTFSGAAKCTSSSVNCGATLVVVDGHLFFGGVNGSGFVDGRILNFSF